MTQTRQPKIKALNPHAEAAYIADAAEIEIMGAALTQAGAQRMESTEGWEALAWPYHAGETRLALSAVRDAARAGRTVGWAAGVWSDRPSLSLWQRPLPGRVPTLRPWH